MKTQERNEARRLRAEEGRSVKEIAGILGVSRSSVSLWVRDVPLTPGQIEALRQRDPRFNAAANGSAANRARARERRLAYQAVGRRQGRNADLIYGMGCMLFWAEGSRDRGVAAFTNSDPEMARFFIRFLRRGFDVPAEKVRVSCHLFADHLAGQRAIEQFWLDTLELPRTCLRKTVVNRYSKYSQKKRKNMLPYGTCRITVCDTQLVQTIYGSIQELAGFTREGWLDL